MPSGRNLAQFEILQDLGAGEFGPVFLARDAEHDRDVEIEILPRGGVDLDRLRQEVHAAAALDHWNIGKVYEVAHAGDDDVLVREHVPGLRLSGPLSAADLLDCARQIAGALAAGHAIGIAHRHLNPAKTVTAAGGRVKLLNFGLTPPHPDKRYLAPEQLDGRGADARADIYAFGLVLREIAGPAPSPALARVIARATQKSPARRYQLMEDVQQALEHVAAPAAGPRRRAFVWIGAAVLAVAAFAWWMLGGRAARQQAPTRLTADAGLTTEPAISADGRRIVYASDRDSPGVLHVWMQPGAGPPVRLTGGADEEHQPALSPDGERVVYRSERDGALYAVPASAPATPALLAAEGRNPRFSPDGRWIACWSGDPLSPEGAAVWIVASSGGTPHRVAADFADARYPIWSPDGKHLLFVARAGGEKGRADWYIAPIVDGMSGGSAARTGADSLLHMQVVRESAESFYAGAYAIPEAWLAGQVIFSGRIAPMGPRNSGPPHLLRIPLDPTILQATGAAHEITTGADWDDDPAVAAGGRIVFSRPAVKAGVWSIAPDGSGEPRRLAADAADVHPSLSADGRRLAYRAATRAGAAEVRVVDLETGRQIFRAPAHSDFNAGPLISPAGDQVVYAADGMMRARLPEGTPEPVRPRRGGWDRVTSWSADGKRLLVERGRRGIMLLDIESGESRDLLHSSSSAIVEARLSPDGKWVAFTVLSRPYAQISLAPAGGAADPSWIEITHGDTSSGAPAWSPDGSQLYYVTGCHGFRCIWARRLDPRSRKPVGEPFAVRHFHHARWSLLPGLDPQNVALAVARDKLVFGAFETTGNIWSLPSLLRP